MGSFGCINALAESLLQLQHCRIQPIPALTVLIQGVAPL